MSYADQPVLVTEEDALLPTSGGCPVRVGQAGHGRDGGRRTAAYVSQVPVWP